MLFINWLAKITDHPIVQGTSPVNVIGIGSHEDCGNRVPCLDEVVVEFEPGHRRHVDIGDQAGRFGKTRGCEEIRRRWKSLDGIAQGPHEPSHGFATEPIIFNDRNQWHVRRAAPGSSLAPTMRAPLTMSSAPHRVCAKNAPDAMPVPRKLWLISGAKCLSCTPKMPSSTISGRKL